MMERGEDKMMFLYTLLLNEIHYYKIKFTHLPRLCFTCATWAGLFYIHCESIDNGSFRNYIFISIPAKPLRKHAQIWQVFSFMGYL
jgi:hypothetical protein